MKAVKREGRGRLEREKEKMSRLERMKRGKRKRKGGTGREVRVGEGKSSVRGRKVKIGENEEGEEVKKGEKRVLC